MAGIYYKGAFLLRDLSDPEEVTKLVSLLEETFGVPLEVDASLPGYLQVPLEAYDVEASFSPSDLLYRILWIPGLQVENFMLEERDFPRQVFRRYTSLEDLTVGVMQGVPTYTVAWEETPTVVEQPEDLHLPENPNSPGPDTSFTAKARELIISPATDDEEFEFEEEIPWEPFCFVTSQV